jgi:SAM-dependent methyltransferase
MELERLLQARLGGGRPDLGLPELRKRLAGLAAAFAPAAALDLGCGRGELVDLLRAAGISARGVERCGGLLEGRRGFATADAGALPFPDGAFGLVTSVLVLHYLRDPARALAEARRVLRPGGRLLLADRIASDDPLDREREDRAERLRNPAVAGLRTSGEIAALLGGFHVEGALDHAEDLAREAWLAGVEPATAERLRALHPGDAVRYRVRIWIARR